MINQQLKMNFHEIVPRNCWGK